MNKNFLIRGAKLNDCIAMYKIIKTHADKGLMRPKSVAKLESLLPFYVVVEDNKKVIGLCGMKIWPGEGVEIISSAVISSYHGQGIGRLMNEEIIKISSTLGFKRFFVLTKQSDFYSKLNFVEIPKTSLGQKVFSDCIHCPENLSMDPNEIQCSDISMELIVK